MAREELQWQNIDSDDLPAEVKKSFDAMVEAEAAFKADYAAFCSFSRDTRNAASAKR
jgi:hypothetical protein